MLFRTVPGEHWLI